VHINPEPVIRLRYLPYYTLYIHHTTSLTFQFFIYLLHTRFSFIPWLITLVERRPRNSIINTTFYSGFRHGLHYCLELRVDRTRLPTAFYWCRPRHAIKLHDLRVTGTALGLSIAR
jgi:hypothetical protein